MCCRLLLVFRGYLTVNRQYFFIILESNEKTEIMLTGKLILIYAVHPMQIVFRTLHKSPGVPVPMY